ncbi:DUF58 domain-containing protein [Thermodesulfobacteriota bacterium]
MIIPTHRLMIGVGAVFLPLSILALNADFFRMLYFGVGALFFMLTVIDAILGFRRFEGIRLEFPEVVHMSKGRQSKVAIFLRNEKMKSGCIRVGVAFPVEIEAEDRLEVNLNESSVSSTIPWPCIPKKQGRYVLNRFFLEISSFLGFWSVRSSSPTKTEIRVYPNLFIERKNLASLFLYRRLGIHTMSQIGKGREFEQLREYLPGDSYEDIHWKATAKRNYPITKTYQIERTQEIYTIIDISRLSTRNTTSLEKDRSPGQETSIMERFVTASLILGLVAIRQGDLFGLLTFSDRVRGFVRAKGGRPHFNACRDSLFTMEPEDVSPDFTELFTFIGLRLRRRSLLVFLTNLDDPVIAENFMHDVQIISKKHLVLVIMLKPSTARPLFSSPSVFTDHDLYGALAGHITWEGLRKTEKALQRRGIGFSLLDNEQMSTQLVSQYLNIKQKQRL